MRALSARQAACLRDLLAALIDQEAAQVLVAPHEAASGFWFGGGSLVQDCHGTIWLSGRYRNYGDSRVWLTVGHGMQPLREHTGHGARDPRHVAAGAGR